jgi:hypothetical protein
MGSYSLGINLENTINTNVGSNADASSATGSVHAKLQDIKAQFPIPASSPIKSVQKVLFTPSPPVGTNPYTYNVTISAVNLAKCEFVVGGCMWAYNSSVGYGSISSCPYYYVSSSGTTVTIGFQTEPTEIFAYGQGSLQVIEFN